ncbi:MAG: peptidase domain-containing ABC transporter [Bacteroidales bacterium]
MRYKIKQRDITDCGAACLASVAAYYRFDIPVARIRQLAGTDRKGTNVLGLVEAAGKMGFIAKGVKGEIDCLGKIPKPAIAHFIVRKVLHHYVVLMKVSQKWVEIMDPSDGEIHRLTYEEFREQWTGVLVIMVPGEKFRPGNEKISFQKRFFELLKPETGVFIQTLIGSLAFSVLGVGMSLYLGKLVDHVLPGGNLNLLNLLGVAMVLVILLRVLLSFFQSVFILKTGQRIDAKLILGYYQHLLKLPQSFFDNMRTGEIISRIGDAVKIRLFINEVAVGLLLNILILVVSFIIMFTFFWKLALIMFIIIPLYTGIYIVSNTLNKKVQRKVMEKAADLEAHLVESLNAAGTVKRLTLEDFSNIRTETRFVDFLNTIYRSGLNSIFSSGTSGTVSQVFSLVILWAGAAFAIHNEITAGELLAFYSVTGYFTGPVAGIIGFNRTLQDAKIAADRLFEIFDLEPEESSRGIELTREMIRDIEFENVKFRYGTRRNVFESLSLTIRRNEITAVVGESGSGKTTLAVLLQNLYPLQSGNIRIGRHDIRHFTNNSVRKLISVVPQKIDLFAGSVLENITIGDPEPDINRVFDICNRLGMGRFIDELPAGFNTWIGENGVALSGGQRQMIAIARTLYRDPEVIIFDEATSSLDPVSEMSVKNMVEFLKEEGKMVIIIAHRFSTVMNADRVIVLDRGVVAEEGTVDELIMKKGLFRKMWQHQSGGVYYPVEQ